MDEERIARISDLMEQLQAHLAKAEPSLLIWNLKRVDLETQLRNALTPGDIRGSQ